jgi:ribosomal protein S27E
MGTKIRDISNLVVCPEHGCNTTHFIIDKNSDIIYCAVCGKQVGLFAKLL